MIAEFNGKYRFLSNFYRCPIISKSPYLGDGILYPSVEHAFQAAKTEYIQQRREIAKLAKAGDAKQAGRKVTLRPGWDMIKASIMADLLQLKFSQEPFRSLLLATGDEELVEGNYWGDCFWGVCAGIGQNMLGKLLMQVRRGLANGQTTS